VRGVRSAAPAGGPTSGPARKRDAQAQQDGECCKHTSETTKKKEKKPNFAIDEIYEIT
jgi:hypothetical protein